MKSLILRIILLGFISVALYGCEMEVYHTRLKLVNQSDRSIDTYINLHYPDSSLKHSGGDKYLEPKSETYIRDSRILDRVDGLTLFIFDEAYVDSKWHEGVGTPDTFLEEDKILKKFYYSRAELDSLGWRLVYP